MFNLSKGTTVKNPKGLQSSRGQSPKSPHGDSVTINRVSCSRKGMGKKDNGRRSITTPNGERIPHKAGYKSAVCVRIMWKHDGRTCGRRWCESVSPNTGLKNTGDRMTIMIVSYTRREVGRGW